MARSVPWRRTCNDLVFWRQTQALNATIFILRETGPTGFLLKEEGETKPCKAFLGDPHSCTCTQFMKDRDLCKHICWLLLKKFRVPQTNPMSWQKGLVEREINEILRGITQQMRKKVPTAVTRWRRPMSSDSDAREVIPQRDIAEDDVCPICQDELLAKRLPVTYCKFGCGNSIHIKCMKVWAEHQKSQGETTVKCPFCREDFGPFELLKYENRNAEGASNQGGRMDRHLGATCQSCRVSPIEGKCYRCSTCTDFHLCQSCFNTPIHTQHAFEYRHKRNQRWRAAGRAYGAVLPQAVVDDLVNRDISDNDYDLLMQLDGNTAATGSDIPEEVIQSFPLEKIRQNGPLLQPGVQCRICLHGYQLGQFVRKLPRCKHKFHKDCIDQWLLHSRPTCPVDGLVVWDRISAQMEEGDSNNRNRAKKRQSSSETSVNPSGVVQLEIPGVGIAGRAPEPRDDNSRPRGQGRAPLRRPRDRGDREAERVLGSLQNNFGVNGTAVGSESDNHIEASMRLPGGRLLHRADYQRAAMSDRLAGINVNPGDDHYMAIQSTQIERENIDPLDQVVAANSDNCHTDPHNQGHSYGSQGQSSNHVLQERQFNHGSIFASDVQNSTDATATLLANMERLSPYRELPNVFAETASQPLPLDSVRSGDSGRNAESQRSLSLGGTVPDIPPEQRLFADSGTGSSSHIIFDQSQTMARGKNSGQSSLKQRRQQQMVLSAPSSNAERGRAAQRRWSQGSSMTRNRSNSRDRGRDNSMERGANGSRPLGNGPIPKEGENLLERLTLFTDLYLGNSPQSNPPVSGHTTSTGLPPRPQRRPVDNHAAARMRRFENDRRRNNFSLEGNACSEMTLRDLLG
ncbi:uncharacterized protein LOC132759651 isoform X2 [Ruditapes philippinarum]|uniref:uncharacterized protein LOC132759651 isoform X2 n=1 Tax=Ruditapes philippinarum TaxID=129788 RepID=UPI00295C279F|nr:uncharacterized protein LOC132759651 isoform X2 [Ruditapes philippinarum]